MKKISRKSCGEMMKKIKEMTGDECRFFLGNCCTFFTFGYTVNKKFFTDNKEGTKCPLQKD